jgi:hypothetical protein
MTLVYSASFKHFNFTRLFPHKIHFTIKALKGHRWSMSSLQLQLRYAYHSFCMLIVEHRWLESTEVCAMWTARSKIQTHLSNITYKNKNKYVPDALQDLIRNVTIVAPEVKLWGEITDAHWVKEKEQTYFNMCVWILKYKQNHLFSNVSNLNRIMANYSPLEILYFSVILCVKFILFCHHNKIYGYTILFVIFFTIYEYFGTLSHLQVFAVFIYTCIDLLVFVPWSVFTYWNTVFLVIYNAVIHEKLYSPWRLNINN